MKMSKRFQKYLVLAFFLGMLIVIFLPLAILDSPINNNDYLAIPNTETISVSPRIMNNSMSQEEMVCIPTSN